MADDTRYIHLRSDRRRDLHTDNEIAILKRQLAEIRAALHLPADANTADVLAELLRIDTERSNVRARLIALQDALIPRPWER